MEAFLLTLDVISIILLCLGVKHVSVSRNPKDMRWFAYAERKIERKKKRGAQHNA